MFKKLLKSHGFSLVEIIVVLIIIAILAAFTIPTMTGFIFDTYERRCNITVLYLKRNMMYREMLNGKFENKEDAYRTFEKIAIDDFGGKKEGLYKFSGLCSDDGILTFAVSKNKNDPYVITCSLHGTGSSQAIINTLDRIENTFDDYLKGDPLSSTGAEYIKYYYEKNGNTLFKVDDIDMDIAFKDKPIANSAKDNLYWRPYLVKYSGSQSSDCILFAGEKNNNSHANWSAYLVYVNGVMYKSTNEHPHQHKIQGTAIANIGTGKLTSTAEVIAELEKLGFEAVK